MGIQAKAKGTGPEKKGGAKLLRRKEGRLCWPLCPAIQESIEQIVQYVEEKAKDEKS